MPLTSPSSPDCHRVVAPLFEVSARLVVRALYQLREAGPGLAQFPRTGPVLVVANHAAWLDPCWLLYVLPRWVRPMMGAAFHDRPGLRWLMPRLGVIRVPEVPLRRESPDLKAAVATLRRGQGVLIFPEGWLRRKEDQPLRRFGQGVWQILKECPETPVVPCWIDGGWGSYTSWKGGPPGVGKRPDFRHRITVRVGRPAPVPPAILADHAATREELFGRVLALAGRS